MPPGKWKSISVPDFVYDTLKSLREKSNKPMWRIIADAVSLYTTFTNPHKRLKLLASNPDVLEKACWYLFKFIKSLGIFHENPNELNYSYIKDRIAELKERLLPLINENKNEIYTIVETLEKLAEKYIRAKTVEDKTKIKIEMNDLTKNLMKLVFQSL